MKKATLLVSVMTLLLSLTLNAQTQIGNSSLETWENVGSSTEEPENWNSFKTATGSMSFAASQQIERSTAVRSGATGSYCARIWSKNIIGVIANGNMTVGQVNMGSSSPSSSSNYNMSVITDTDFSEVMTDSPDSLVFWVKYTNSSSSSNARVKATIHDNYAYRDPEDATSPAHIVATAVLNYPSTGGSWQRMSVPFDYSGPATTPAYILITFATNMTPGGGDANDEVLIDDIELIYNSNEQIIASDDVAATTPGTPVVINVVSNDSDPENQLDLASLSILTAPVNGNAQVNTTNGELTYTPNTGFSGEDSLTYRICDAGSPVTCDSANVYITVIESAGVNELEQVVIQTLVSDNFIHVSANYTLDGTYILYNASGNKIAAGNLNESIPFEVGKGVYFLQMDTNLGLFSKKILRY